MESAESLPEVPDPNGDAKVVPYGPALVEEATRQGVKKKSTTPYLPPPHAKSPSSSIDTRGDTTQKTKGNLASKGTGSKYDLAPLSSFNSAEPELHRVDNPWSATRKLSANDTDSSEYVKRKVKVLLNKLTMEKFDSISVQILGWADRSIYEVDARTLNQVIRLVFEAARNGLMWSEMYARLCHFLVEHVNRDIRHEGTKGPDGKPISGGNLFRKYLLNSCQEYFERAWSQQEVTMVTVANKPGKWKELLYSDEYCASQKAKRHVLGVIKFLGELFKIRMVTERVMHECIKKLLSNVEDPADEEIESLCMLLSTVGRPLDTPKARNHMDIYFSRMQELSNNDQLSQRIRFLLLDVIELRKRSWVPRTQVAAPTTVSEIHQMFERGLQVSEKEAALRQAGVRDHLTSSHRGMQGYGSPSQVGAEGWTTPAARPTPKAGDLSSFGRISKPTTRAFGPSSVFTKKERRDSGPVPRPISSSSLLAALSSMEATLNSVSVGSNTGNSTGPPSRKTSIGPSASSAADKLQSRRLLLQPGTHSLAPDAGSMIGPSDIGSDDAANAGGAAPQVTMEQAKRKIKEDVKRLFMLRQLSEADGYFSSLPTEFRWCLVEELVHKAVNGRASDVKLVADVFNLAATKFLVDEGQFAAGFASDLEYLEDTSADSPNAYAHIAILMKAAKLSQASVERLADGILAEGETAVTPREKLLAKYAATSA